MSNLPRARLAFVAGFQNDESSNQANGAQNNSFDAWSTKLRSAGFEIVHCLVNPTTTQLLFSINDLEAKLTPDTLAVVVYTGYVSAMPGYGGPVLTCRNITYSQEEGTELYADEDPFPRMRPGLLGVLTALQNSRHSIILLDACTGTVRSSAADRSVSRASRSLLNDVQAMLGEHATLNKGRIFQGVIGLTWTAGQYAVARSEHGVYGGHLLQVGMK
jgi:hypothetical protein